MSVRSRSQLQGLTTLQLFIVVSALFLAGDQVLQAVALAIIYVAVRRFGWDTRGGVERNTRE